MNIQYKTLILLTIILVSTSIVLADEPAPIPSPGLPILPAEPHQFYGQILVNGQQVPNNMLIEAYHDKVPPIPGAVPVGISATRNGNYGYSPYIMIITPSEGASLNAPIEFYLIGDDGNRYFLGSHPYEKFGITRYDFSITCTGCVQVASGGTGGGAGTAGGGGSPGGRTTGGSGIAIPPISTSVDDDTVDTTGSGACVPNWICSEWTDCVNQQQRRVCVDRNDCGVETDRPTEDRTCESEVVLGGALVESEVETADRGIMTTLTGFATGVGGTISWIVILLVFVIIAGLYFLGSRKKK
ncbi:MAG: hypothetical protein ACMXYL_04475 [Candidatus Woesearchaeota archaeon]